MLNYFYNIKKYFTFSKKEIRDILLVILLFTFVLAYDDGTEVFVMKQWLFSLLNSFAIISSAVLAKELGHKFAAIKRGYTSEFKIWWPLFGIVAVVSLFSKGQVELFLPVTGLFIFHHERMRIGEFRYGHNYMDNAIIAFSGPLFNIYLALLFKAFSFTMNPLVVTAMRINLIFALVNLLPLDILFVLIRLEYADLRKHRAPLPGTYIAYGSKMFFVFTVAMVAIMSISMFYFDILSALILSALFGAVAYFTIGFMTDFTY